MLSSRYRSGLKTIRQGHAGCAIRLYPRSTSNRRLLGGMCHLSACRVSRELGQSADGKACSYWSSGGFGPVRKRQFEECSKTDSFAKSLMVSFPNANGGHASTNFTRRPLSYLWGCCGNALLVAFRWPAQRPTHRSKARCD